MIARRSVIVADRERRGVGKFELVSSMDDLQARARRGIGAELVVCADLLERGYYVFRAMTANAPFDLVACRYGAEMLRVEVKRGQKHAHDFTQFDLLAVVDDDRVVRYYRAESLEIAL